VVLRGYRAWRRQLPRPCRDRRTDRGTAPARRQDPCV